MPDDDWSLSQGTVDFRNEGRMAFNAGEPTLRARSNPMKPDNPHPMSDKRLERVREALDLDFWEYEPLSEPMKARDKALVEVEQWETRASEPTWAQKHAEPAWVALRARAEAAEQWAKTMEHERDYEQQVVTVDLRERLEAAEAGRELLASALKGLVERVEMDESVGICLTSRVDSLNAMAALRIHAPDNPGAKK